MAIQTIVLEFDISVVPVPPFTVIGSIGSQSFRGAGVTEGRYLNRTANLRFNESDDEITVIKNISVNYPPNTFFTQT
jgi:hypothetical protein